MCKLNFLLCHKYYLAIVIIVKYYSLNETWVNYDKNFANENTTAFRYIKNKQKLDLRTKNILKNIKKLNIVPPLGYYQPDYDFIKPRVSSVCFNKSRERKWLFSSQIQNEIPLKSKKSIFKTNNKRWNNLKRPRTNIINIKKRRSNQLSPAHSKTKYSINLFNDPIQSLSYCKAQTKSCISTNNRRSMSSMSNHIVSFIRNPIASSPKLSSSNTTLLSSN